MELTRSFWRSQWKYGKEISSAQNLHFKDEVRKQRCKGDKGASYTGMWRKRILGNGNKTSEASGEQHARDIL